MYNKERNTEKTHLGLIFLGYAMCAGKKPSKINILLSYFNATQSAMNWKWNNQFVF